MNRRVISLFLLLCLVTPLLSPAVKAEEIPEPVTMRLESDLLSEDIIHGVAYNGDFYIRVGDAAFLTGMRLEEETMNSYHLIARNGNIHYWIDKNHMEMKMGAKGDMAAVKLHHVNYRGDFYISALDFLHDGGANIAITGEEDDPCLHVLRPYDLHDGFSDFFTPGAVNPFSWSDFELDKGSLEKKLMLSGFNACIHRDANLFNMIFQPDDIYQKALEEALVVIVTNEGQDWMDDSDLVDNLHALNATMNVSGDVAKQLVDLGYGLADTRWTKYSDLPRVGAVTMEIIQTYQQYEGMKDAQKNLLQDTILENRDKSRMLQTNWRLIEKAAENVERRIHDNWNQTEMDSYLAAMDFGREVALKYGTLETNAIWYSSLELIESIPEFHQMFNKQENLFQGYNCSMIQAAAGQMLSYVAHDWLNNGSYIFNCGKLETKAHALRQHMILWLKAGITTREYLIESQYLDSELEAEFKAQILSDLKLLAKIESAWVRDPYTDAPKELYKKMAKAMKTLPKQWRGREEIDLFESDLSLEQRMLGEWGRSGEAEPSFIFYPDGTCIYDKFLSPGYKANWNLYDDQTGMYVIGPRGTTFTVEIVSCDGMNMHLSEYEEIHLRRMGSAKPYLDEWESIQKNKPQRPELPQQDLDTERMLLGKWEVDGEGITFEFLPDGSCLRNGQGGNDWYLEGTDRLCMVEDSGHIHPSTIVSMNSRQIILAAEEDGYIENVKLVRVG